MLNVFPDGLSPEHQLHPLQQALEQEQIANPSHEQFSSPSSSWTPMSNEQDGVPQEIPASQAGETVGIQATDEGYSYNTASVDQAQEQQPQQIINPPGKQLPSPSLAVGNNGQDEILQDIPATQAGETVGVQPTDGCHSNNTNSLHQAQEQQPQQIINPPGKQLPSPSLAIGNNGKNEILQGIPATQAGETVNDQPSDDCEQNDTARFGINKGHGINIPKSLDVTGVKEVNPVNQPSPERQVKNVGNANGREIGTDKDKNGNDPDGGVDGNQSKEKKDAQDLDNQDNGSLTNSGRSHGSNRASDSIMDDNATINSNTPRHSQRSKPCKLEMGEPSEQEPCLPSGITYQDNWGVPPAYVDESMSYYHDEGRHSQWCKPCKLEMGEPCEQEPCLPSGIPSHYHDEGREQQVGS